MEANKKGTAKKILLVILLVLAAAAIGFFLHIRLQRQQAVYQVKVDENALENREEGEVSYRKIEVDGQTYRYNTGITNILYMGVDTESADEADVETAQAAGQADAIMLLSVDRRTRDVQIIAIPRDTMTKIRMYDNAGNYLGKATQHLSLAYAYGDGEDKSCRLVAEAVSQLLEDIPIQKYISSDLSSISQINDLVGGVTVTVPGDVLEYLGARFKKGRMERQKVYLTAYLEKLQERANEDMEGLLSDIEDLEDLTVSNLTATDLEQLLTILSENDLNEENYHILEGEDRLGELHDEFYADEEKLQELILDLYYVKV